ncbi:hypothetical protein LCGC14_0392420 [marine sediment metagenome]|uniref:Uncharacterized protein n=1 Tax=marine sediment metagenome TaxID=412755 RepID=A0A0F9W8D5_9ZZZZ
MSGGGFIGPGGTGAVQVLDWKEAVETVSTANIALTGEQTLNGLLTSVSRVGVTGQTDPTENSIYVSAVGAWVRAADADTDAKVTNGLAFAVGDSGSTLAGNIYILTTPDPITLGVTSLTFSELTALPTHATSHENGGADEINVDGLSGELADPQPASLATLLDLDSVGDLVFTKVGPPGATQDSAAGWVLGDHIYDVTPFPDDGHAAVDVSIGAAIWRKFTGLLAGKDIIVTADITDDNVTDAKLAEMPTRTIKGNDDAATANPQNLTVAEVKAMLGFPPQHINGLELAFNTVSTVDISVGECRDSTDAFDIVTGGVLTANLALSGAANRLDTGAEAADTWYAVHIIDGDVPVVASLLSLSATAPTLPATYTRFRHVGWVRNNSSSNILEFIMVGADRERIIEYQNVTRVNLRVLNNGSATAMTTVALNTLVPPTAQKALMNGLALNTSDDRNWAIAHGDSTLAQGDQPRRFGMNKDAGGFDLGGIPFDILVNASQEVVYGVSNSNVDLDLFDLGYYLVL